MRGPGRLAERSFDLLVGMLLTMDPATPIPERCRFASSRACSSCARGWAGHWGVL